MSATAIETCAWQTGKSLGLATYSKLHIWNARRTRMLCGAAPNWRIGNIGPTHSGECSRCFATLRGEGE